MTIVILAAMALTLFLSNGILQDKVNEVVGTENGPAEEIVHEAEIYTSYTKTKCRGIFSTKCEDVEYVEVIFTDKDGNSDKFNIMKNQMKLDNTSRIEELKTETFSIKNVYITKEEYLDL